MTEDRAEGLDLDALKKVAQAAYCVSPGTWAAQAREWGDEEGGATQGVEPTGKFYSPAGFVPLDEEDVAAHIATFDPPTVLNLIALAHHDQATPGVEIDRLALAKVLCPAPMWSTGGPDDECRCTSCDNKRAWLQKADRVIAHIAALPTTIRGGREEIARIIDPDAYGKWSGGPGYESAAVKAQQRRQAEALAKADALLALPASIGVGKEGLVADNCAASSPESGRGDPTLANTGLDFYDAGLLGSGGGGDVDWWQDYIRAELERAHDFYAAQHEAILAAVAP